jgi:hypothetical protein
LDYVKGKMMTSFKQALEKIVSPRLAVLGYELDDSLQDRNLMFAYSKQLGNSRQAVIQFQREQHEERAYGSGFTVNLIRNNLEDPRPGRSHEVELWSRIGEILWFVYDLRLYPSQDKWWVPTKTESFEDVLIDAVDQLEAYGIPWLEDPESTPLGEIPLIFREEFIAAQENAITGRFEQLGYGFLHRENSVGSYYVKELPNGIYAFVEFRQIYDLRTEELGFDVICKRKHGANPDELSGQDLYGTLGLILNFVFDLQSDVSPIITWRYRTQDELEKKLIEVMEDVEQYVIPWLEDPESKDVAWYMQKKQ